MTTPDHSEAAQHYRDVIAPEAIRRLNEGGEAWETVRNELMEYLQGINFGLTDEERARAIGEGGDQDTRRERLEDVCKAIVLGGTIVAHTPGELLRDHGHRFAEKTWLERLEAGTHKDFVIVINEIDEAFR